MQTSIKIVKIPVFDTGIATQQIEARTRVNLLCQAPIILDESLRCINVPFISPPDVSKSQEGERACLVHLGQRSNHVTGTISWTRNPNRKTQL